MTPITSKRQYKTHHSLPLTLFHSLSLSHSLSLFLCRVCICATTADDDANRRRSTTTTTRFFVRTPTRKKIKTPVYEAVGERGSNGVRGRGRTRRDLQYNTEAAASLDQRATTSRGTHTRCIIYTYIYTTRGRWCYNTLRNMYIYTREFPTFFSIIIIIPFHAQPSEPKLQRVRVCVSVYAYYCICYNPVTIRVCVCTRRSPCVYMHIIIYNIIYIYINREYSGAGLVIVVASSSSSLSCSDRQKRDDDETRDEASYTFMHVRGENARRRLHNIVIRPGRVIMLIRVKHCRQYRRRYTQRLERFRTNKRHNRFSDRPSPPPSRRDFNHAFCFLPQNEKPEKNGPT